MKQCRLNGLMDFDKNVVYPFFEDEGICKGVCNALGYDVNKAFEARYKKVYEVYTLGKLKFKNVNATPFCLNTATLDCQ